MCDRIHPRNDGLNSTRKNCNAQSSAPGLNIDGLSRWAGAVIPRTWRRHTAWQIPAFRSYADYADGDDFSAGLDELIALAVHKRTAYMCSEGLWWRCHRRIISDHLVVRGWTVMHIVPTGKLTEHALPDFAHVEYDRLIYAVSNKK